MFDYVEIIDTSDTIIPIEKLESGIPISTIPSDQIPYHLKNSSIFLEGGGND
jgi:hypothetical protein